MKYICYLLFIGLLFIGCTSTPSPKLKSISSGGYEEADFESIPSWQDEDFEQVINIFLRTCKRTAFNDLHKENCAKAKSISHNDPVFSKQFFEKNFTPFVSLSKSSLATGYYEPTLQGSLEKTEEFLYPVYGVPSDLVKPYFTRKEISSDALTSQKPICYVNDYIDLFFLHVQGSGCVMLNDDSTLYLGYADQNGHAYVSIGKEMIKRGLLSKEDVSLESITSYLENNPSQVDDILSLNPSYVFFETRSHSASGALGLVLEKGRSVAVDKKNIPLGMPLFISTVDPLSGDKYEKMVFAHDTGSAIKGESRIDLFFGSGEDARKRAGEMNNEVKIWILVPNDYLSKQEVK